MSKATEQLQTDVESFLTEVDTIREQLTQSRLLPRIQLGDEIVRFMEWKDRRRMINALQRLDRLSMKLEEIATELRYLHGIDHKP